MKVKELIEELQKIDSELEIILSKDKEGNRFSPLDENYGIEFYDNESVEQEILPDEGITLEEFIKETNSKKCITLYPLN